MASKVISVYENTQKLGAELAKNLSELANDVLAEGGNAFFKIGLSGMVGCVIFHCNLKHNTVLNSLSLYYELQEGQWSPYCQNI